MSQTIRVLNKRRCGNPPYSTYLYVSNTENVSILFSFNKMSRKLHTAALREYAATFTQRVVTPFFATHEVATGPDLLELTPLRQTNLFLIWQLYDQWKTDAVAFESPYFDFAHQEVRQALEVLMNTASRHISVRQEHLSPLLVEATQQTLLLLLTPEVYFDQWLRALPGFVFTSEKAQQLTKYTAIHAGVARQLAERLQGQPSRSVYVNEALQWLLDCMKDTHLLDDPATFLAQFSAVAPLDLVALGYQAPPPPAPTVPESTSFFDSVLAPVVAKPTAEPVVSHPVPHPPISQSNDTPDESVNGRFKVEMPAQEESKTYGTIQVRLESLSKSIGVGQRYMFIGLLFGGDAEAYQRVLDRLDASVSLDEARELLFPDVARQYGWDLKSEPVVELLNLLKRRFS